MSRDNLKSNGWKAPQMQKVEADSEGRGKAEETKKNSDGETPCSFQDGVRSAFDVVFIQLDTKENPVNLPGRRWKAIAEPSQLVDTRSRSRY
ncbi:hypothetical protein OIU77_001626 [Salix suchowensis]|uniref:Uncharacterized protein n=1 Tax=Salix suchowensis TaxID=1278906 RepID=A0ABQ9B3S0_9ROSI|nr:hypothetical protein OIU77_001626 [Salix suchowensis]